MRVLQIIDSLEAGGAEKVAVNYANALRRRIPWSGLCPTRKEGPLKAIIENGVAYLPLQRRGTFDFAALFKVRSWCVKEQVDTLHAHGTSFLFATMLKIVLPSLKLIWHDHYGDRDSETPQQNMALILCSLFFSGIVVVNRRLEAWARSNLRCRNVIYLPNFTVDSSEQAHTDLAGIKGKRILCLANLREPKNHLLIADAAVSFLKHFPDWTFHFVGKDSSDHYSEALRARIDAADLQQSVYIYGLCTDTRNIIAQCDICVLASDYEGLPMALLEYGALGKAVILTAVGEIPNIIESGISGIIVPPGDSQAFAEALVKLAGQPEMRISLGTELQQVILDKYSERSVIDNYMRWIKSL